MASCTIEDYAPLRTTSQTERRKKKKKSKKMKKEKDKIKSAHSVSLNCGQERCSEKKNNMDKNRRKDGKSKRKKNESYVLDKSGLRQSDTSPQEKTVKVSHEVGRSCTDNPLIQTQDTADLNECVSKAMECARQRVRLDKARPKKRVVFDLSPNGSVVKKYFEAPSVCSTTTFIGADEEYKAFATQLHAITPGEPEGSPEGIGSQELFITQNKFLSPVLSDEEVPSTPEQTLTKSQQPPQRLRATTAWKPTAETASQTENFFTSKLSAFLNFKLSTLSNCTEQPVDLSLPHRQRAQQMTGADTEESDRQQWARVDLNQLKVVQTRLNESFFFKVKGEKDSPKSHCPLRKLKKDT
ncbi:hypothetical protein ACEWY4_011143 [Coilia grayii]|uniref:Protein CUSTOS n=1 Tax=Coilia grayii TaxID=363190 RepID=A0ABD1K3Y0_9TELE